MSKCPICGKNKATVMYEPCDECLEEIEKEIEKEYNKRRKPK